MKKKIKNINIKGNPILSLKRPNIPPINQQINVDSAIEEILEDTKRQMRTHDGDSGPGSGSQHDLRILNVLNSYDLYIGR